MTFIEAVIKISQTEGFEFCDFEKEHLGHSDICVYQNDEFVGKLRWPVESRNSGAAGVDESLIKSLRGA